MSDALFRLVGDGDRHSGGAVPLPDAFAAVVNELIANGDADFRKLNQLVSDTLAYKEERVMAAAWRSWQAFTRDIITVLEEMNLVKETDYGRYELTHEFVPNYTFYLPGTDIPFVGRSAEDRERWHHNELMHLALNPVIKELRERAGNCDPLVKTLIEEAEKVLVNRLKLDQPLVPPKPTRYRQASPRKPHEEGKRIRKGMTGFFRDIFWVKYAKKGEWYDLADVARKFEELYPDQPKISHSGDLMGSMRKAGRDMAAAGILDMKKTMGDGSWKHIYRLHSDDPLDNAPVGTIMQVERPPVVTWEGIRKDPKDVKWETPPPASTRYLKNSYEDEAKELKEHPGEWGVIAEFKLDPERGGRDNNEGRRVANQIRQGKYKMFRPAGSYEAVSRIVPEQDIVRVHARYVGKD